MKNYLLTIILILLTTQLFSQTKSLKVFLVDSTTRHYPLGEITKLTFKDDPCDGVKTLTYSGKTYTTEQIGTQCWLAQNLDVGTYMNSITGGTNLDGNQTDNSTIEKYCYNNDSTLCKFFGGLYQWDEAMSYNSLTGLPNICPTGWHIPTITEVQTLKTTVSSSGNALKTLVQGFDLGVATNTSGFSALLAGYWSGNDDSWHDLSTTTVFWMSSYWYLTPDSPKTYSLASNNDNILSADYNKNWGFSIRCLKD